MINSVFFQICSFFYVLLLTFVYFSKKRLQSAENSIYAVLIVTNLVGLILDVSSIFTIINMDKIPILNFLITKGYLVYLTTWISLLTAYIFLISKKDWEFKLPNIPYNKFVKVTISCCWFIISVFIFILPLHYESVNNQIYSYGPSASLLYLYSGICILVWIFVLLKNFKTIKKIKCVPIFAYMLIGVVVIFIQLTNPNILLMTSMETFITFLMYFTIENPDMKLINELNIARDQAEKANNAKTDFLSNMSHEIRTPLNAIVGFSQALVEEDIPESAKGEVKDILMASENLLDIVNGILDISKIEANKLEIVNTEYSFQKILNELVSLTRARLGDKPLDVRINFDPSIPPYLYGDYVRLKQIVLNLLTNAVKYTKEGYVEFKVSTVKKGNVCRLIISVEDSGIGIAKEKVDKLFTKFQRFDVEKNITIEGTGLGLAITKKLVELMNGKIVVQSIYGKGSRFTVAIDQRIVTNPTTIKADINPNKLTVFDASDKKILIVDDNKVNLKVASRLLKDYNAQITEVMSGYECIDLIRKGEDYDLILMDDMMPKMTGVETLHLLKQDSSFSIPTVALTANAISGMKEKYLSDGFDDYLSKPINKNELNQVIHKYLAKNK